MENKIKFIEVLSDAFQYSNTRISSLEYVKDEINEYVKVNFNNGTTRDINVKYDSCLAMLFDISRNLM